MKRKLNFSPGPSILPLSMLYKIEDELVDYKSSGESVMEMNYYEDRYQKIFNKTKGDLYELFKVLEDEYEILFMGGGASTQFALIPMNFLDKDDVASYINTGVFSDQAIDAAKRYANIEVIASSEDDDFKYIPDIDIKKIDKNSKYLYLCTNNTAYGTRIAPDKIPDVDIPIIADMTSNIFSEDYDYNKFDMVIASAQKNLGIAGVTIVLIKRSFLERAKDDLFDMLSYKSFSKHNSQLNTPPTFNIYVTGLMTKRIKKKGITNIWQRNKKKAKLLYDYLDDSKFYEIHATKNRSIMNILFFSPNKKLDDKFIEKAKNADITNVNGHEATGGLRVSIYNAMPMKDVKKLIGFMKKFEKENS